MNGNCDTTILLRNRDVEHIVNAAANLGHYAAEEQVDKRLTLLVATDIHRCRQQVQSMVEYLNGMEAIDAGICLGDIQGSNFVENDGVWYTNAVNQSAKPFYTVVGNHDCGNSDRAAISGTKAQVFQKFFAPTLEQIGIPGLDKTWYAVNFDAYKVTLIVLDNYDSPEDRKEDGDFVFHRSTEYIGQEQTDWLIETLRQIPEDYHVLIARHAYADEAVKVSGAWTVEDEMPDLGECMAGLEEGSQIEDIIHAWMEGIALKKGYVPAKAYAGLPSIHVNADFSKRGKGIFIGYLIGHYHQDWQGYSKKYPDQQLHCFASSANDGWQNYASDLPRYKGTKAEDCLTAVSVDHKHRRLCMVRVGSNVTSTMVDRTFTRFSY